jgi:hypothetical protein
LGTNAFGVDGFNRILCVNPKLYVVLAPFKIKDLIRHCSNVNFNQEYIIRDFNEFFVQGVKIERLSLDHLKSQGYGLFV